MEAAVQQYHVDKQCFEIQKKQFLIENDLFLDQIISQDIVNIVLNSSLDINTSMNENSSVAMNDSVNYVEMCNKCLELEIEIIKQHNMVEKDEYNKLSKRFSELEQHNISLKIAMQLNKENFQKNNTSVNQTEPSFDQLFNLNNLKAELQAKDTTIEKLKANIKRFNKTSTTNSVKKDIDEIETINIEMEHKEKVFVITTLKNNLGKFKGKDIVDNVVQASNATTIALGMYKLDPVTLAPKDKNNMETHIYYLKHTIEQAAILREIVEQSKSLNPLDSASYSSCKYVKLIQELLGYVRETCFNIHKPSEKLVVVTPINIKKTVSSMFDARHELCFLEFVTDMNASSKSKAVKKDKKKEEWKPTGKVITTTNKVPLRVPIPLEVITQESVVTKVYTRRPKVVQIVLWYLDSGCSKHMTGDGSQLTNFVHKFLGTIKFDNDQIAKIMGVGISHETSVARTPQQNGVVERRNRTLVEAARTKLIFAQAPLFLWAEAITTVCYTQNRSIIRRHHGKTPYELLHDRKPNLSYLHVFGALCYPNNDSENLGKLQAKADIGIFIGYAPKKKAYRNYNRRTKKIIETIYVDFDELTAMASEQLGSGPGLQCMTLATSSSGLVPNPIPQQPFPVAAAPRAVDLADSLVSTSIDQDAPSTNSTSHGSSSNERPIHTPFKSLGRWTKDHPVANIIVQDVDDGENVILFRITNFSKSQRHLPNQSKYAYEIIKKYGMLTIDSVDTPMVEKSKLDEDLEGKPVDATLYYDMIRSLMYLTSSRPNHIYAVCLCARYQAKPTEKHLNAIKRIFRYLKGTINLGDKLVSWSSKKQKSTAISSTEVEYISLSGCCAQILWMRSQLTDYGFQFNKIPLYRNNKSVIALLQQHTTLKSQAHRCTIPFYKGAGEACLRKRKTSDRGRGQVKVVTRESCLPLLLNEPNLILNLSPRRKGLRLENATKDSILERNRENLHFKLSWMILLSLHAIPHFSPLQMFLKFTCTNSGILSTSMILLIGHTGEIKSITDVVVDQMHQPWRTFATIINKSLSGKTTGLDKLRVIPPKKARKFKKPAYPMLTTVSVSPKEPTRKSKRVKRPAKKSTNAPIVGVVIRDNHVMSLSKKKKKMTYEEVRKKSLRDYHKTHPSGSAAITKVAPSAANIKHSVINEGTGAKPGVLDVTEEESSESEAESWGRDEDDNNNNHDSSSEGNDQESDGGDNNTQSDNGNGFDFEYETDENETGFESDHEENEEDVEDDEQEKDDEFVKTPSNSTDDEDETNVEDKAEGDEDKGIDYTTNQFDDDVDQGNENPEITLNQVIEDAHVTNLTVAKKTEVPVTSSSHSSDLASKFLGGACFILGNGNENDNGNAKEYNEYSHNVLDAEIVSLMDVHVYHKVPSNQRPTLLTVPVLVITESSPVFTTVILQSLSSFTPPPPQSTSTPPLTTEATNPLSTLLNFAFVFQFNNRDSALEKEVVELKKDDILNT
ncbi:retrovirus-related pol polyprotein from transposon TNT 1-94 [Tanacetum coccineum]